MKKSLIYGPVTSRRLGLSLGIDSVPYKTCSFDCIYCQIGRTKETVLERRDFGLSGRIFEELAAKLDKGPGADCITLGGSGEPTLNRELETIVRGIKKMTDLPLAVLTNGSLLWHPGVAGALEEADILLPSLDAADEEMFRRVNRPHPEISFERYRNGIIEFSRVFPGKILLEIFLVKNINTSDEHLAKLGALAEKIAPDRIHVNTAVRPPAENFVEAVGDRELSRMAAAIGKNAEVIASFQGKKESTGKNDLLEKDLLDMLFRRPCTIRDIAAGLNVSRSRAAALVERLVERRRVTTGKSGFETYYRCTDE